MSENAISNNNKIFLIFAKKLTSNDIRVYSNCAQKLSLWLSSDKAYYPAAKPKILTLLETAQSTLQREIGDSIHPFHISRCPPNLSQWGEAYEKLVRTVISHSQTFKDAILQDRVQCLANSIALIPENASTASVNRLPQNGPDSVPVIENQTALASHPTSPASSPKSLLVSQTAVDTQTPLYASNTAGIDIASTGQQHPSSVPPPPQIITSQTTLSPVVLPTSESHANRRPAPIIIPERVSIPSTSGAPSSHPTAHAEDASPPSTVAPAVGTSIKLKSKKKRKSTASYANFLVADLEWYKQKGRENSQSGANMPTESSVCPPIGKSDIEAIGLSATQEKLSVPHTQQPPVPLQPEVDPLSDEARRSEAMALLTAALGLPLDDSTPDTIIKANHNSDVPTEVCHEKDQLSSPCQPECSVIQPPNQPDPATCETSITVSPTPLDSTGEVIAQVKGITETQDATDIDGPAALTDAEEGRANANEASNGAHLEAVDGPTTAAQTVTDGLNNESAMDVDSFILPEDAVARPSIGSPPLPRPSHLEEVLDHSTGRSDDKILPTSRSVDLSKEREMAAHAIVDTLEEGEVTATESHTIFSVPVEGEVITSVTEAAPLPSVPQSEMQDNNQAKRESMIQDTSNPFHPSDFEIDNVKNRGFGAEITQDVALVLQTTIPNTLCGSRSPQPSVLALTTDVLPHGSPSRNDKTISITAHLTKANEPDADISRDHGNSTNETSSGVLPINQLLPGILADGTANELLSEHPAVVCNANVIRAGSSDEMEIVRSNQNHRADRSLTQNPKRSSTADHNSGRQSVVVTEGVNSRKRSPSSPSGDGEDRPVRPRITGPQHAMSPLSGGVTMSYAETDEPTLNHPHSSSAILTDTNKPDTGGDLIALGILNRDRSSTAVDLEGRSAVTADASGGMNSSPGAPHPSSPSRPKEIASAVGDIHEDLQRLTGNAVKSEDLAIFGPEMSVIAIQRGSKSRTMVTINFNIDEAQFSLVSKWNNRNKIIGDVTKGLCLSLACYHCTDLQVILGEASKLPSPEELTLSCRRSWPQVGGLYMKVKYKEDRQSFPLSPPFVVTPDNLVDLSPFLEPGSNIVQLDQQLDMSDYIFVLHAHFPTPAQLREVSRRHKSDQEWKKWLLEKSQPLKVHFPWGKSTCSF